MILVNSKLLRILVEVLGDKDERERKDGERRNTGYR